MSAIRALSRLQVGCDRGRSAENRSHCDTDRDLCDEYAIHVLLLVLDEVLMHADPLGATHRRVDAAEETALVKTGRVVEPIAARRRVLPRGVTERDRPSLSAHNRALGDQPADPKYLIRRRRFSLHRSRYSHDRRRISSSDY